MIDNKKIPRKRLYVRKIIMKDPVTGDYLALQTGEKLIYGLKKDVCDEIEECVILKELTDSDRSSDNKGYWLQLSTQETDLPLGKYYYDIVLQRNDGELVPVVNCTEIHVVKSVVR